MTASPAGTAERDEETETGPNRRCIVTGEVRPIAELVRFVVGPDETLVPDVEGRLPGRGIWLSARRDVVNTAVAKRIFAKAARRAVVVPPDLADRVEGLLARRCADLLGLARRGGQAVAGFDQVRGALAAGRKGLLFAAVEGAADGRRKLQQVAPEVAEVAVLRADELGAALGREHFVHVLVAPGRIADRLSIEAARLAGFRTN